MHVGVSRTPLHKVRKTHEAGGEEDGEGEEKEQELVPRCERASGSTRDVVPNKVMCLGASGNAAVDE